MFSLFCEYYNKKKTFSNFGFTLIELLVVIAIIGILSSVVLVSVNNSRSKARDTRRINYLHQITIALENYADDNNSNYPATLDSFVPTYIPIIPVDPKNSSAYKYAAIGSGVTCNDYHLGAVLENNNNPVLSNDSDATPKSSCMGLGMDSSVSCFMLSSPSDFCYDIKL